MGPLWLEDDEEPVRPALGDGKGSAKQEICKIFTKEILVGSCGFLWAQQDQNLINRTSKKFLRVLARSCGNCWSSCGNCWSSCAFLRPHFLTFGTFFEQECETRIFGSIHTMTNNFHTGTKHFHKRTKNFHKRAKNFPQDVQENRQEY